MSEFAFGQLTFLRPFIILILFCVGVLSDTETNKQTENSAPLSRDNSAHLARVLQLRQNHEVITHRKRDEKRTNAKTNNGKAKRYKCFLVDDNDSEENLTQQKSYFAKFQERQRLPTDILGWEESPRRSAGAAGARYLYFSTKGTTPEPIIEYIDEDNLNEAEVGTTAPFEGTAEFSIGALAPQRTTMRAMAPKQQKLNMQTAITATTPVSSKTSDEKQQEEEYIEGIGDDLYIATTARKPPVQQQQTMPTTEATKRAQVKMPRARSIPGVAVFDGGTNKIVDEKAEDKIGQFMPAVKIKASMRPFNVPMAPPLSNKAEKAKEIFGEIEKDEKPKDRTVEETQGQQQQQQQLIRITPLRKGATDQQQTKGETEEMKPKQWHGTKTEGEGQWAEGGEQRMMPPIQNVQRDAQGRPLLLSPEHCKMVDHYSSLYGVKDVPSFVHNNCAFAKMYLPTATCAEIDILISSCYQPRNDQQQLKKRGRL
ncbi:hypothetical protein niasHT_021376 [Heterodera trifolii]|uniref:aECM cysteine-cradle domain-containing protein n=1 Tax=Heterodera trifolii TaxID=157864 RepID=A0ABD2K6P1_9BILA